MAERLTSIYTKKVAVTPNQPMRSNIFSSDSRFAKNMSHFGQEASSKASPIEYDWGHTR